MDIRIIPNGAAMARPSSINTAIILCELRLFHAERVGERRKNSMRKTGMQEATGAFEGKARSGSHLWLPYCRLQPGGLMQSEVMTQVRFCWPGRQGCRWIRQAGCPTAQIFGGVRIARSNGGRYLQQQSRFETSPCVL